MVANIAAAAPFVRDPGVGSTLNVLGVTHIYKATAAETGGSFSLWEAVLPPGTGAPPHTHTREDEAFYILSGELLVEFEGAPAPHRVGPGGFFFGARDRRHAIRNAGDPAGARFDFKCAQRRSRSDVCRVGRGHYRGHARTGSARRHHSQIRCHDGAARRLR